jgi:hypothetical protein
MARLTLIRYLIAIPHLLPLPPFLIRIAFYPGTDCKSLDLVLCLFSKKLWAFKYESLVLDMRTRLLNREAIAVDTSLLSHLGQDEKADAYKEDIKSCAPYNSME